MKPTQVDAQTRKFLKELLAAGYTLRHSPRSNRIQIMHGNQLIFAISQQPRDSHSAVLNARKSVQRRLAQLDLPPLPRA